MKMNRAFVVYIAVLLVACAGVSKADSNKELDIYKGNLGKYACDGKEVGSGKPFKATVEHTVEFDGNTYIERYTEMKSADHPNPWKGIFIMSYDPDTKQWVRNGVDNGGARNAASSTGWNGNTWVWENDGANIVINKQNANAYTFDIDVKEAGGNVKRVVSASCKRI
jgi:hypothetical protein